MIYDISAVFLAGGLAYLIYMEDQVWNTDEMCKAKDLQKSNYGVWREWTGGGYAERLNPAPHKNTDLGAIIQSNPVTGAWEEVDWSL